MELLKLLSIHELIIQLVCFFAVLFLLKKFVWGKVLTFLDERKQKIKQEFDGIEQTKVEIAQIKKTYETHMQEIEATAKNRIQAAIEEGYKLNEEIRKRAEKEAEKIIDSARDAVQYEVIKARNALKDTIVDMTLNATQMMLQEKMTEQADAALIKQFLQQIEEGKS